MRRSQTPRSQTYQSRELGKPWSHRGEGGPGELGGSLRSRSRLSPPPPANELWASRWPRTDLSPRLTSRRPVRLLTRSELPRLPPGPSPGGAEPSPGRGGAALGPAPVAQHSRQHPTTCLSLPKNQWPAGLLTLSNNPVGFRQRFPWAPHGLTQRAASSQDRSSLSQRGCKVLLHGPGGSRGDSGVTSKLSHSAQPGPLHPRGLQSEWWKEPVSG